MPYSNSQLPGSSSSISVNESPIDEINYDSDISEDDHAIAEGDDDEYDDEESSDEDNPGDTAEDEEEPDDGFAVEVSTLTGNTFNIMIHPEDTVEVLKTRIAFQEGISPADQNILLDSSTGCSNNATVQELNIDRHSKLTLVTNVASGVPYKTSTATLPEDTSGGLMGSRGEPPRLSSSSPPSFKLAPTIKRNYTSSSSGCSSNNNHSLSNNNQQKNSSSSSSSSLRLPKILSSTSNVYLDKNCNIINGGGGAMYRNNGQPEERSHLPTRRLDEREWMKSLFNKVVHQDEEDGGIASKDDDEDEYGSSAKVVIDIDSTTRSSAFPPPPRVNTRYIGTKYAPEEDGSILVVQGDDGVILIIQKNTGQLLEESYGDSGINSSRTVRFSNSRGDDGRVGRLGRYTQNGSLMGTSGQGSKLGDGSSYRRNRYEQQEAKLVHDKIKENAVTLEKMRQVRGMMEQQKRDRSRGVSREKGEENRECEGNGRGVAGKTLEFPKICSGSKPLGVKNGGAMGFRSSGVGVGVGRKSAGGKGRGTRSINSSKMSLNRLIAEIYLQTKRKDRQAFQPGQPPYTDQQLLRYVQLKTAILVDEQRKNKTEPCSKCQLDDDWSFNEEAPYLIPTVVLNRYKRLENVRNSKSLEKDEMEDELKRASNHLRRKSMIPVVLSSTKSTGNDHENQASDSYIPRLILVNRERSGVGANRNSVCSVATTVSIDSRRSSSSISKRNRVYRIGSGSSTGFDNSKNEDYQNGDFEDEGICDTIIITGSGKAGGRPTFKVYPKIYSNGKTPSRPGSSSKANAAKKTSVRCQTCKKKIGIACRYQCRCGLTFCSMHRYPETHECTFDYKTDGRNKLRETHPVIVAPKIQEI